MQRSSVQPSAKETGISPQSGIWKSWAAVGLSAGLLELPFPLAGPMPVWRSVFAWFGLVPLLYAVLSLDTVSHPRLLSRAFLLSYVCGVLWYAGNCYWVRDVMRQYGDMPPLAPELLLAGFSVVLGLYFGLFGLGRGAGAESHRQLGPGTGCGAVLLGCTRTGCGADYPRALGSAWIFASRQRNRESTGAVDWCLRDQFLLVAVNALIAAGVALSVTRSSEFWASEAWLWL